MDLRLLLGTGIRIFSICMALEAFRTLYSIKQAQSLSSVDSAGYILSVIYMVVAVISWLFPLNISAIIVPSNENLEKSEVKPIEFARVSTSLFALYLILNNIWALFPGYVLFSNKFDIDPTTLSSAILTTVAGLIILLNNKKIAMLMCK